MQILSCGEKYKVSGSLRFPRACFCTGPLGYNGVKADIAFYVPSQEAEEEGKRELGRRGRVLSITLSVIQPGLPRDID